MAEYIGVFVPGKPFQPSLMFAGKVRNLHKSGTPERCSPHVGSGLTHKYQPSLMFAGKVKNLPKVKAHHLGRF